MEEAGAFYVMDRGNIDFERLYRFVLESAFFVVRTKSNVLLQRRYSRPVGRTTGLRSDHTVILASPGSVKAYPDVLRRITYCDPEAGKRLKYLTNNFPLPPLAIAEIYKNALGRMTILSLDQAKTPSSRKSGSPSRSTCWRPSSANGSALKLAPSNFYRLSACAVRAPHLRALQ
jgi:hypothetical protein